MSDSSSSPRGTPPSALARWAAVPVGLANTRTAAGTLLGLGWVFAASLYADRAGAFIGLAGLAFLGVHVGLHLTTLSLLNRAHDRTREDAAAALATYRDPRRINNLDIAMVWGAVATLADLFG